MFYNATGFNQPLNGWDVGRVTSMSRMFYKAASFNRSVNAWDVGRVRDMFQMFSGEWRTPTSFNKPLNAWDVGQVTSIDYMFRYARAFDQPLDAWNTSQLRYMWGVFSDGLPSSIGRAVLFDADRAPAPVGA